MKKYCLDLLVTGTDYVNSRHVLLTLCDTGGRMNLENIRPGQFAEVLVNDAPHTFLRRPVSIHFVNPQRGEISLLVQEKGEGTRRLINLQPGEVVNVLLPLGNGFTLPQNGERMLLVGGGVGVAPLLFLGHVLCKQGLEPTFLLGARSEGDLLERERFEELGRVLVTTEDGSIGEKGFVTQHSLWASERFDRLAVCGPLPMMKAVARRARELNVACEVSLENMMACGLGACLCCVEKTTTGNRCVCKDGPVFNINELLWQD